MIRLLLSNATLSSASSAGPSDSSSIKFKAWVEWCSFRKTELLWKNFKNYFLQQRRQNSFERPISMLRQTIAFSGGITEYNYANCKGKMLQSVKRKPH